MTDPKDQFSIYFHVHLVSDSTGETLMAVMRASVAQFRGVSPIEHLYALVRSPRQLDRVMQEIEDAPGIVMYTLVNNELRGQLEARCAQLGLPAIPILDPALSSMGRYLGIEMSSRVGAQRTLDAEYYSRIEALNYAMAHDDGANTHEFEDADIVLVGVSRTSKTPTCVYLAQRGVKAANIPIVPGAALPDDVLNLKNPLVVGLTAAPERLVQIRRNRLLSLHEDRSTDYVDEHLVKDETIQAKRLFARKGWPMIDVTRRSIEESAAKILNFLADKRGEHTL